MPISGKPVLVRGLREKPAMVAARFVAPEPIEEGGEHSQGAADVGGAARVVRVADRHSEVVERGQRVAALGL